MRALGLVLAAVVATLGFGILALRYQPMPERKWLVVPTEAVEQINVGKESAGTEARCPEGKVMTGRMHKGDENKATTYECAGLRLYDPFEGVSKPATITVENPIVAKDCQHESSCDFVADNNRVITGRYHFDDENGPTKYWTSIVKVNGEATTVTAGLASPAFSESSGQWWRSGALQVMVGRTHTGDENDLTSYRAGSIVWIER